MYLNNVNSLQSFGLVPLNQNEVTETDGGILPLVVIVGCALLAGCQSNKQNNNKGKIVNIQYNGGYPDTTIIRHGDGSSDTIINK